MVGSVNESMDDITTSPSSIKNAIPKNVAELSERYELAIRQMVAKLVDERNALEKQNTELQAALRELTEEEEKNAKNLQDILDSSKKEITALRAKCQQLQEKLHNSESALESEVTKSIASPPCSSPGWHAEKSAADDEAMATAENSKETTDAGDEMVLGDIITVID